VEALLPADPRSPGIRKPRPRCARALRLRSATEV